MKIISIAIIWLMLITGCASPKSTSPTAAAMLPPSPFVSGEFNQRQQIDQRIQAQSAQGQSLLFPPILPPFPVVIPTLPNLTWPDGMTASYYRAEASSDLVTWERVLSIWDGDIITVIDPMADTSSHRFYRAVGED